MMFLFIQSFVCPDVPGSLSLSTVPSWSWGKVNLKVGDQVWGEANTPEILCRLSLSLSPLLSDVLPCPFSGRCCHAEISLRVWGALFVGQNAAVWGSSDSQSGRAVCFKWAELKELCPRGAEGEAAVKIETLLQEVAPKRLLPKLKQFCGRKKWLGLPVILAANSTSNLCTLGKLFP